MTGPNAIQRIADAVGAPIGTSRRVVHGAETPMGVVWRRDDGHEFAVWREPLRQSAIALEVSHYDSQDELKACDPGVSPSGSYSPVTSYAPSTTLWARWSRPSPVT
jgi:hypothetical protein